MIQASPPTNLVQKHPQNTLFMTLQALSHTTPKPLKHHFHVFDPLCQNRQIWPSPKNTQKRPQNTSKIPFPVKTTMLITPYPMYTCTRYSPCFSTHKCTTLHMSLCTSYNDAPSVTSSHFSTLHPRAERKNTPLKHRFWPFLGQNRPPSWPKMTLF